MSSEGTQNLTKTKSSETDSILIFHLVDSSLSLALGLDPQLN